MKTLRTLAAAFLLSLMGTAALAQSVTFTVEELIVPPSDITTTKCVQVGIYMTYTGPTATWGHFEASLDYTAPGGFLAGDPFVNVTDFDVPGKDGLTNPGSVMDNGDGGVTPCVPANIINALTLAGSPGPTNLMTGAGGSAAIITQDVNAGTGAVDITSLSFGSLFTTNDGETYLMAILEFPLAAPGTNGQIDIEFRAGAAQNFISDGITTVDATPDNGFLQVFQTEDCGATNNATFSDALGSNSTNTSSGSTLDIDYLDPALGGPGGEIDVEIAYSANVEAYQITGTDGTDTGVVSVDGTSPDTETFNPSDPSTTYTLTYFTLGLDGITLVPGTSCDMTVGWNPASCTANWVNNGIGGANSTFTVTLTNAAPFPINGSTAFANVDVPDGATGLSDPTAITSAMMTGTTGSTATFLVFDASIPDGTWAGDWDVVDLSNPNTGAIRDDEGKGEGAGRGAVSCSDVLGFTCPTNNATVDVVTIGQTITVNLIGSDELSWDVTYAGVTTTGISPDDATFVTPNAASAVSNTITVVANGVGPDGLPCPDTQIITLDYADASCDSATQNPDSTVTPVDVGTVITLSLVTSGAVEASIDGVPMTAVSGTVGFNNTITWEATHTAVADTTITAVVTNPDGDSTSADCSWEIDINCIDPVIANVAPLGDTGITIAGTPDCTYLVRLTDHISGSVTDYQVTIGANGEGTLNITIPPDTWIEVGQDALPFVATDMTRTVPTLGEWGLIAFVMLLMVSGVAFMRRKRLV